MKKLRIRIANDVDVGRIFSASIRGGGKEATKMLAQSKRTAMMFLLQSKRLQDSR